MTQIEIDVNKLISKEYRENNREILRERSRKFYHKNSEKNRESHNARSREYTANNLERVRKQKRDHMRRVRALKKLELSY